MNTTKRTPNEEARLVMGKFYDRFLFYRGASAGYRFSAEHLEKSNPQVMRVARCAHSSIMWMSGWTRRNALLHKTKGLISHDRYLSNDKREMECTR